MFRVHRSVRLLLLCALCIATVFAPAAPASASPGTPPARAVAATPPIPSNCTIGNRSFQGSSYEYWICMPANWVTKDLVAYAHGYVGPDAPAGVMPLDQLLLPGTSTWLPDVLTGPFYNYAFVATSYRVNGLAAKAALEDLKDLVDFFKSSHPDTRRVYLGGVSEGGLITTLAIEDPTSSYSGGLAICGPIGDFNFQINYFTDFRVVFDYFFPGLMDEREVGTAIKINPVMVNEAAWQSYYLSRVVPVITKPANAYSVTQVLKVTNAPPYQWTDAATVSNTVGSILWYNVFATNDALAKLGGQPYDNMNRHYSGSDRDVALNAGVARYSADAAAVSEVNAHYQTTGRPLVPLVTVHTKRDQVVPYQHEVLYLGKIIGQDMLGRYDHFEPDVYGHCQVDIGTIAAALSTMVDRVDQPRPLTPSAHRYLPLMQHN
jgi:hypothetical protein